MSRDLGKTQRGLLDYMLPPSGKSRRWYTVEALTSYVYLNKDTDSHRAAVRRALSGLKAKRLVEREPTYPHRWRHSPLAKVVRPRRSHPMQMELGDYIVSDGTPNLDPNTWWTHPTWWAHHEIVRVGLTKVAGGSLNSPAGGLKWP